MRELKVGDTVQDKRTLDVGIITGVDLWGYTPATLTAENHGTITVRITHKGTGMLGYLAVGDVEHYAYLNWAWSLDLVDPQLLAKRKKPDLRTVEFTEKELKDLLQYLNSDVDKTVSKTARERLRSKLFKAFHSF